MANADELREPNPWHPMKDPVDLKHMGKFTEELGECTAAVSRCIIQGIDEQEPITLKPNKEWLEDEIADVLANINLVARRFNLDRERIKARVAKKEQHLTMWHNQA